MTVPLEANKNDHRLAKHHIKTNPILFTALALALPLAGANAQQWSTNTLPPGLIAWWQAEGNMFDSAGPHHGAGSTTPTYAPGRFGQAFQFNGWDQSVSVADSYPDLDNWPQFTLEAWFNMDTVADSATPWAGRAFFSKVGNPNDNVNFNKGYQFAAWGNGTKITLAFNTNGQAWPGFAITWPTAAGMFYRLQTSPDLTTWVDATYWLAGTGGPLQMSFPTTAAPQRFFGVVIED